MFHFLYRTINLSNGKIYIGKHSSDSLDDGYIGKGKRLLQAIRKYGRQNFRREILRFCGSEEEAYLAEGLMVDKDFTFFTTGTTAYILFSHGDLLPLRYRFRRRKRQVS